MNAEVKSVFRNGLAARPDATPAKKDEMADESKVTLPGWVLPMMVTILLAFIGNLSASLYWAGQVASNQAHMVESLGDLKSEVRQLRNENQGLREQLAGLAAAARQR